MFDIAETMQRKGTGCEYICCLPRGLHSSFGENLWVVGSNENKDLFCTGSARDMMRYEMRRGVVDWVGLDVLVRPGGRVSAYESCFVVE